MPNVRERDRIARVKAAAELRWPEIFAAAGMDPAHFMRQNRPCPLCGGCDRFSFFAKEFGGRWFCRGCGAGDGIDLVMRFRRCSFSQALEFIAGVLGISFERPRFSPAATGSKRSKAEILKTLEAVWERALSLKDAPADNPVRRYLCSRGLADCNWSTELRWLPEEPYWDSADGGGMPKKEGVWPVMLARVSAMDGSLATLHRTYLTPDGRKAPVPSPKKLASGGGAEGFVRLFPPSNLLCLAEGIETALAVHVLTGLPAWSVISLSGFKRFDCVPAGVRSIRICGDNDSSFAGAAGAYELAARLRRADPTLEVSVSLPDLPGQDWNDVLLSQQARQPF